MGAIAFEGETHGIVEDHLIEGVSPKAEQLLAHLESDGRIVVERARIQNGIRGKVLRIVVDGREHQIDFQDYSVHLGGNTFNTATAMTIIRDAFENPSEQPQHLFYTHVYNAKIHEDLTGVFGRNGVFNNPAGNASVVRKGYFIPKSNNKSDGWYVSQTPEYAYREAKMAGMGSDFFFSSLHSESTLMERLIKRKKQSPKTQITMAPGKQQLAEGLDPDFSAIITLEAMNAREAIKLLGDEAPRGLEGEALVKEMATLLANKGPEQVLITNGGLPVTHYDRIHDVHTVAQPPSVETMQKLIWDLHGEKLADQDVSRIGCGDTLLGVFMGLQKIRNQRGNGFMTCEQALQFSVIISRYHAWDKRPNIVEIDQEFLKKLARHISPNYLT